MAVSRWPWCRALLIAAFVATSCGESSTTPTTPTEMTRIADLTLRDASIIGGQSVEGFVILSGPAAASGLTVNISSSAAVATVPSSLLIRGGETSGTFLIDTQPVSAAMNVTINATINGATKSAGLMIKPPAAPAIEALQVDPSFGGGQSTVGTVQLDAPAPQEGVVVMLSSDNSALTVPSSVTVPAASRVATFNITSREVNTDVIVTVSASTGGQTRSTTIRLRSPGLPNLPTLLSFVSAPGHPVGQGRTGTFMANDGSGFAGVTSCGQSRVHIRVRPLNSAEWNIFLFGPRGSPLAPGTYRPFSPDTGPQFSINAPNGCAPNYGQFVVTHAVYGTGGTIRRFRATFEQRCFSPNGPPLTGEISVADPPIDNLTSICN